MKAELELPTLLLIFEKTTKPEYRTDVKNSISISDLKGAYRHSTQYLQNLVRELIVLGYVESYNGVDTISGMNSAVRYYITPLGYRTLLWDMYGRI